MNVSQTPILSVLRLILLEGKWHLGQRAEYLPLNHGFDTYLGIPYRSEGSGT